MESFSLVTDFSAMFCQYSASDCLDRFVSEMTSQCHVVHRALFIHLFCAQLKVSVMTTVSNACMHVHCHCVSEKNAQTLKRYSSN